jgi:hypothetical protein
MFVCLQILKALKDNTIGEHFDSSFAFIALLFLDHIFFKIDINIPVDCYVFFGELCAEFIVGLNSFLLDLHFLLTNNIGDHVLRFVADYPAEYY